MKKKTEEPAAAQDEARSQQEFIPYFCHYNPTTLLTKNGELMQTIRIVSNLYGLNYESGDSAQNSVRGVIRQAITGGIGSDKFSLWVHTIRKRKPVRFGGQFDEPSAAYVYDQWQKKQRWKYQYYNEVYVTVLHEGQAAPLMDQKKFQHVIMPKRNSLYRNAYLKEAMTELDQTVAAMLQKIRQHYDANLLSTVERMSTMPDLAGQSIFYSEPMEFLGTLLNLQAEAFPLTECDISSSLATSALTFGFNVIGTRHVSGGRRFSAMMSLKQYREVPTETIDRVLQAPIELIISEAFHFMPNAQALENFEAQKEIFSMSNDEYSARATGLEDMMKSNRNLPIDFGKHQITVAVLADEFKHLDSEVLKTQEAFSELGLITVREDIKLEECFWAQFPRKF